MSYALANSTFFNSVSGSHTTLTVPATTIGNLLFITFCYGDGVTIASCTGGATWALLGTRQDDAGNGQATESRWGICTSSVTTVTFTSISADTIAYMEISSTTGFTGSPLRAQDTTKAYAASSTLTDAETSNNITPTAGDLVIGALGVTGGNEASITKGTGWTTAVAAIGTAGVTGAGAAEYMTAAGGSQNATFTVGTAAGNYTAQIAAFIPGTAAAGQPLTRQGVPFMSNTRI